MMINKYTKLLLTFIVMASCHHKDETPDPEIHSKALVKITGIEHKDMQEQVALTATSIYLQHSQVNASVSGYITLVKIKFGDMVIKGEPLYEMETKERKAIGNEGLADTSLKNFGKITINAPSSGIITTIERQQSGEYIMEGNPLCTITQNGDLAFQLNVPFEYHSLIQRSESCVVILPDKSQTHGHIIKPLSSLNPVAQTQMYLVKPDKNIFLPEGLVASVLLTTQSRPDVQVLPKSCILSDELMKTFWIMKLINDSIAVKVNVQPGIMTKNEVEIIAPKFNSADRILSEGNYGLGDTAMVKISKIL